jgi:hypothetical protein
MNQLWTVRLAAFVLAVFLAAATSACGGNPKAAVSALKAAVEEAPVLISRPADPAEFSNLSNRLKAMSHEVTASGGLSDTEQTIVDTATQRAAILQEIAGMLGVPESIKGLFKPDAVLLVRGSFLRKTSSEFEAKLDEAAEKILVDSTCSALFKEMSALSFHPTVTAQPGESGAPAAQSQDIYAELTQVVTATGNDLSVVQQYVDLSGLSSSILSAATGYVGKVKKTVSVSAWDNGGAARAYLQVCVFNGGK